MKRSLGLLAYMATHSLMRTLARRHRSSVAKIARKLRAGSDLVVREEGRSRKVWLLKHLDLSPPAPVRVGPAGAPLGARDRARPLRR